MKNFTTTLDRDLFNESLTYHCEIRHKNNKLLQTAGFGLSFSPHEIYEILNKRYKNKLYFISLK